jgi:hypothetical protein
MHAGISASTHARNITASGSMHYDSAAWNVQITQMIAQVPHVPACADVRAHGRDEGIY